MNYVKNHFTSKAQSNFLQYKKETVSQNKAIILLDFAKNYLFINQDAVQGFHWENSQATLHPFVVYYRNTNESRESQSLCVVWDHQKHNQSAVHSFLVVALSFVKSQLPLKVIYFSDGAASQYKNYKTFFKLFSWTRSYIKGWVALFCNKKWQEPMWWSPRDSEASSC